MLCFVLPGAPIFVGVNREFLMLTFEQTLHRHPSPSHLRIHLVHPRPKASSEEGPLMMNEAKAPSHKLRSRLIGIASAVAAAPAILGMLYLAQDF